MKEIPILLCAAKTDTLSAPERFAAAYAAVSPARRQKTDALQRDEDKRRSLAAGLLLRQSLSRRGAAEAEPALTEYGMPYLPGGPRFSLSHSGDWVLCAVAERDVGCDIQRMAAPDLRVAKRCFAPEEYADLQARPDRAERFYRYWTLKESFAKALGLGMHLPFRDFRMILDEPVTVVQQADRRSFGFAEFSALPGYRCALCAEGGCGEAKLEIVTLEI